MGNSDDNRSWWRFFDGSASVSVGMLAAVAFRYCGYCDDIPILSFINGLTRDDDGVIIVATLLLFPTTAALYGGLKMFFAAKEAVEKKARERGRREGRQEGRQEMRERIMRILAERGTPVTQEELAQALAGDID